jgi:hypothetical protein
MKCWICGNEEATTREHRSKASDLRSVFGDPTQAATLYLHTAQRRNRKVGSLKADALKFTHRICLTCNSATTQPHDYAWAEFSSALRSHYPALTPGATLRFSQVFSYDTRRRMLNVHLYFVKLFGCQIVEGKMGIDTSSFSQAILGGTPHANLYLAFGRMADLPVPVVGGSNVEVAVLDGKTAFASWIYQVGHLFVDVVYATEGEHREGLVNAWHPRLGTKRFTVKGYGM